MVVERFTQVFRGDTPSLSRRGVIRTGGAALAAAVAGAAGRLPAVAAQDATPSAVAESDGLTTELLGFGVPGETPDQAVQLIRFTVAPGASTEPHRRAGARVDYVASGSWEVTVVEGNVELQPAGGDRTTDREALAPGSVHVLAVGDSIFLDDGAVIASRNTGAEPLVVLSAAASPASELTTESIPAETPGATPAS